jgi:hypothetical protein
MRILTIGLLLATGLATAASAQTVGGTYSVSGTNADGSSYTGTAEITVNGAACSISWKPAAPARPAPACSRATPSALPTSSAIRQVSPSTSFSRTEH